jgi:hypothetical protein
LETGFVAAATCSLRLSHDVDRKASFSVDETGYPADSDQSFLLIVRIRRFITAWIKHCQVFAPDEYRGIHGVSSI